MASETKDSADPTFKVPPHRSFFLRAIAVFFCIIALITALQLLVLTHGLRNTVAEIDQQQYWGLGAELANRIQPLVYDTLDVSAVHHRLHELFPLLPYEVLLLNARGEAVASYPSQLPESSTLTVPLEPLKLALANELPDLPLFGFNPVTKRNDAIFSVAPLVIERAPGYLYVLFNAATRNTLTKNTGQFFILESSIAAASFVTLCSWILSLAALLYFGRRFRKLVHVIQSFQMGDFSVRAETIQGDEIAALGKTLNSMADTIQSTQALLVDRDKRRRELVADIVHDMRGPLTVLRSTIDRVLSRPKSGPLDESLQQDLQVLQETTLLQNVMVQDLFSLSKLEAQERLPELDDISLPSVIERTVSRYRPVCAERHIELVFAPSGTFPSILADETLVARALSNLIENAMHYSPEGGAIEVSLTHSGESHSKISLSVGDSGPGISTDEQLKIFERGYGEKVISRGAGLGLAIVRRIADLHGAELKVANQPGRGAQFSIVFSTDE